jgi:hypothetical protein
VFRTLILARRPGITAKIFARKPDDESSNSANHDLIGDEKMTTQQKNPAKVKGAARRRAQFLFMLTAAVLGALLITGCGRTTSGAGGAQQLIGEFPWLASLGLAFIQGLLEQFGSNLGALLAAAAAAL